MIFIQHYVCDARHPLHPVSWVRGHRNRSLHTVSLSHRHSSRRCSRTQAGSFQSPPSRYALCTAITSPVKAGSAKVLKAVCGDSTHAINPKATRTQHPAQNPVNKPGDTLLDALSLYLLQVTPMLCDEGAKLEIVLLHRGGTATMTGRCIQSIVSQVRTVSNRRVLGCIRGCSDHLLS